MPSLRQLLTMHAPLLAIDAAASRVQVGVLRNDGSAEWQSSDDEAGVAIFSCIEKLGLRIEDANAFVFCDGPGSILGIRSVAMALRTWCVLKPRPMFAYTSLAVVAHALNRAEVAVISDARRDSWHHYQIGRGLRRVPASDLEDGLAREMVTPESFRNWSPLPPTAKRVPYSLAELLPRVMDADLFLETNAPDAFLHEEPNYVTWTPQIHRAR